MKKQVFEILTVGIPFALFKWIAGEHLQMTLLKSLGIIDLGLNLINLLGLVIKASKPVATCGLTFIAHKLSQFAAPDSESQHREELGNSLDTILAFSLVAYMIGMGILPKLNETQLNTWNLCVIFNVLGAGASRLSESFLNFKK